MCSGLVAQAPSTKACPHGCSGSSFLPRKVLWYRKAFTLPAEWSDSLVYIDFEGSFRQTTVWINGVQVAHHACGYTPFRVRLDNLTSITFGESSTSRAPPNVITVFVDPDNGDEGVRAKGSGWWY